MNSAEQLPPEFRIICHHLYSEVLLQFPGFHNAHTFVGGFLFLRYICPAIVAPESYNLCSSVPSMDTRRGLILVSKALQNLSNGVQFGSKEEYMMPMNPFIVANIHRIRDYLIGISQETAIATRTATEVDVDSQEKQDSLDVLHRHLFVNQDRVMTELAKVTSGEGINRDYIEHLATFDLLLSYPSEMTEEISSSLIADLPLVCAICESIPPQDHTVSKSLITIFEAHEMTLPLLHALIAQEINNNGHSNMLFRGFSPAMRMCKDYFDIIGITYLQQTLGVSLKIICKDPQGYEIDPRRLPDKDSVMHNAGQLDRACQELLNNILNSKATLPYQIRDIARHIADSTSSLSGLNTRFIADFVFSKFFNPAVLNPLAYSLVEEAPGAEANRVLLLMTKVLQAVANSKRFPPGDILEPLNGVIGKYEERIQDYISFIIDIKEGSLADIQGFLITSELLENSVRSVHQHMKAESPAIRNTLTPDAREAGNLRDRLEAILLDMGPPIQASGAENASR
jgi:hypothetical protein